jgi:hypothetical protein
MGKLRKAKGRAKTQPARESCYNHAYSLPSVNQMMTAGGAGYNDPTTMPRIFPVGPMSRIQTPINNVGAFLTRYTQASSNLVHRGIMWCR